MTTTPPVRPLSELTDEEAYQCFAIAFGEVPIKFRGIEREEGSLQMYAYLIDQQIDRMDITIWENGNMAATGYYTGWRMFSPLFHAPPPVRVSGAGGGIV